MTCLFFIPSPTPKANGLNLTQIKQQCKSSKTTDGTACDLFFVREEKTCFKMMYYNGDVSKAIDTMDITNDCHTLDHRPASVRARTGATEDEGGRWTCS